MPRTSTLPSTSPSTAFYSEALDLVDQFFPGRRRGLAKMVYGKRAASCLYSLAETLRRRRDGMGTAKPQTPGAPSRVTRGTPMRTT